MTTQQHLSECKGSTEPYGDPRFHYCCPECDPGVTPPWEQDCICDRLRAAQQRVLNAAREAVRSVQEDSPFVRLDDALDAIDAVRGAS